LEDKINEENVMKMNRGISVVLTGAVIMAAAGGCASASGHKEKASESVASAQTKVVPVKNPEAMGELKKMGDALSSAKSMSFVATMMTPIRGANAQWIHVFTTAKVQMKRPNKLSIETGGDAFPQHIYFDGTNFVAVAEGKKLFSQTGMPGDIDSMLAQASKQAGDSFPFADVLIADPLASWSAGLEGAVYVGESNRGGEKLQHIALTAKDVTWEVWTDEKSHLPRMVFVKYIGETHSPSVLIELSKWKINSSLSDSTFKFKAPKDYSIVSLKAPEGANK
jgi:hypothetical protein